MQTEKLKGNLTERELEALPFQLPFAFEEPIKVEIGLRPVGFRFFEHVIEIRTKLNGAKIVACGEAHTYEQAKAKAVSELIERAALISKPQLSKTSNGWAAHPNFEQAKHGAILELVERDAVLAQWYSATPFLVIGANELPVTIREWAIAELAQSEFKTLRVLISTEGLGPAVTCLLVNERGFGVSGHSTKEDLIESIESAIAEACRAAHAAIRHEYWNDTLRLKAADAGTLSPGCHSVYYAYHEAFPELMFGPHISWNEAGTLWQQSVSRVVTDVKFEFHEILNLPIHVGFAKHSDAFELRWGTTDAEVVLQLAAARRLSLKTINLKPHIVA